MNLVKRLLIVSMITLVPMLQASNAWSKDFKDKSLSHRNNSAIYISPESRNNIRTRTVFNERFNDVWDALLIHIDEEAYNPVSINESEGKIVVDKYSEFDSDLDCGAYESRQGRVSTKDVITTYSYLLTRINDRKSSLTLDVDGTASWQINGRNRPEMRRYGISDSACVSVGSYENNFFNNIGKTISLLKRPVRVVDNRKKLEQKKRDRLARIEARRQLDDDYRQRELRQQREIRRPVVVPLQRESRRTEVVTQQREDRRREAIRDERASPRQQVTSVNKHRPARKNIAMLKVSMNKNRVIKLLGQPKMIKRDPRQRKGNILIYDNLKVFMLNGRVQSWK